MFENKQQWIDTVKQLVSIYQASSSTTESILQDDTQTNILGILGIRLGSLVDQNLGDKLSEKGLLKFQSTLEQLPQQNSHSLSLFWTNIYADERKSGHIHFDILTQKHKTN